MIDEIKISLEELMEKSLDSLRNQLSKLRTGRANANVLQNVRIDYYGTPTPINQVGKISTPEARVLQIQPFDRTIIGIMEKAIMASNLGLTPSNDGNFIRIPFPSLTEERRKEQVRDLKKIGEDSKIALRNLRREKNEFVKNAEKDKKISEDESKKFHHEIQIVTDKFILEVDKFIKVKEKEILEV
jgi:ribosome recycling factor